MTSTVVRLVLAIALLFSSVGVTSASTLCRQQQRMTSKSERTPVCMKCKASTAKNACCKKVYTHLSVKSEYQRPATSNVDAGVGLLIAVLTDQHLFGVAAPVVAIAHDSGPPIARGARERCALTSTYRI